MDIKFFDENISLDIYGGKAYGLSLLVSNGFNVPKGICIPYYKEIASLESSEFRNQLEEKIRIFEKKNNLYHLAVRSSSLMEDMTEESKAGHFLTIIDDFSVDRLVETVIEVYSSGDQMGIVVQEAIDADFSGVFFSSDPTTYSKKNGIISYVEGMGEQLVSGETYSKDVSVSFDQNYNLENDDELNDLIKKVISEIKDLEQKLGYPLDVEYCIKNDDIYYLQCRPITSISSVKGGLYSIKEASCLLPNQILSHDKIQLRLEAEKTETFISDAYIYVENDINERCIDGFDKLIKSKYCSGYSAVVIYPKRVMDKVVRSFVGNDNVKAAIGRCYRYGIKSYPEHADLEKCVEAFCQKTKDDYWVSAVIIQEIFDAQYTGILQKSEDEYVVEIAKGHFLTKGNVLTSQYYVHDGKIIDKSEAKQNTWYKILQGHVIECYCENEDEILVSLTDDEISEVIDSFKDVMFGHNRVIEFGIVREGKDILPYLIDFVDSDDFIPKNLSLEEGVISVGKRKGIIKHLSLEGDALNMHLNDERNDLVKSSDEVIFVCDRPSIALLDVIKHYDESKIAFVFRDGSILCHLSVVLREKGIPAIKCPDCDYIEGKECILDAETIGVKKGDRVIYA